MPDELTFMDYESFGTPHARHFLSHSYSQIDLARYAGNHAVGPASQYSGLIKTAHNVLNGYPDTVVITGMHCCSQFCGLEVAFQVSDDPSTRELIIQSGHRWLALRRGKCDIWDQKRQILEHMEQIERLRRIKREDAARKQLLVEEQLEREAREAREHEKRRRLRREAAAQRLAARNQRLFDLLTEQVISLVEISSRTASGRVTFSMRGRTITLLLRTPCHPQLALVEAARLLPWLDNQLTAELRALSERLLERVDSSL